MKFPQIFILAIVLSICLFSCRDATDENRNVPNNSTVPSTERNAIKKTVPERDASEPNETPAVKKLEKKKSKKRDTLKPIRATP
jgi:hypothetical protein